MKATSTTSTTRPISDNGRRDVVLFVLLLVTLMIIGTASFFAFHLDEQRRKRLTAEVPATIIDVYVIRDRNNEMARPGSVNSVRLTYRYVLNGETFTRTAVMNRAGIEFKVGSQAKACYNPNKPEEVELLQMNHQCGL